MRANWTRLICLVAGPLLTIAATAPSSAAVVSAQTLRFREECSFRRWDTVDAVKAFYGVDYDPIEEPSPLAGKSPEAREFFRSGSYYRFPDFGVWIFFAADRRIATIRFDHPFSGRIGGVAIGTTRGELERIKGKPARSFIPFGIGLPDQEFLKAQEDRKRALVGSLPDPVPKRDVVKVLEALAAIDREPLQYTTPLTYKDFRYDIGLAGTVQTIIAPSCMNE